ncbi:MAG TPA: hypothetical protein VI141_02690 [Acidimicrobiia bacterium]
MRRPETLLFGRLALVALALIVGACSMRVEQTLNTLDNVECDPGRPFEEAVFDFTEGAVGHPTIADAIEAFRTDEPTWRQREDWHALVQSEAVTSPVEFKDEQGRVYLSVQLINHNDSWLVAGYLSCAPPGA